MKRSLLIGLIATIVMSTSAMALERKAVPFDDNRSDDWNAGATCRVNYYNICTGWVWCWSGFGDDFRIGLVVQTCTPEPGYWLLQSSHFLCSPAPSGYGFTGTIAVYHIDANNCPIGAPIASQPYLPTYITFPFSVVQWGVVLPVPSNFALVITTAEDQGLTSPAQFGTDHPAAGPTGPVACGTCYPPSRPNHSFGYGTSASPICPGSTFNDGICNAQLFWDVDFLDTISVEPSSWGSIKGLYR
jgi:hypothetical protein